jgi:hypothetical protein
MKIGVRQSTLYMHGLARALEALGFVIYATTSNRWEDGGRLCVYKIRGHCGTFYCLSDAIDEAVSLACSHRQD